MVKSVSNPKVFQSNMEDMTEMLLSQMENMIQSIDDMFIFFFFNSHLQKLREKIIKVSAPREEADSQPYEAQVLGNMLDKFLRRCLIACG